MKEWEIFGYIAVIVASYTLAGFALFLGFHIAALFFPSMCFV